MSFSSQFFSPSPDTQTLHFALHALGFPDAPRAEKLLRSLTKNEGETFALGEFFDDLLENLSRSAEPMRALLNFSNLCDRVPDRASFFVELKENPAARLRLAQLFSWSQTLSDSVIRNPDALQLVFQGAAPLSRPQLRGMARLQLGNLSGKAAFDALRKFRRAQFVRIGLLDLEGDSWRDARDFSLVVRQISDLAQVVLECALDVICDGKTDGFCILIMGKGGARELNYSSDVDLIFLHDGRADAAQIGQKLVKELSEISAAGQLYRVDMRLRPDGGNGALVTPFGYALSYYESYAAAWEWQALIKARVVAGDARLGRRFRKFTRQITWARRADDGHLREVFEMKKRSEKTADGMDARNLKSGPGGIRDAEWIVQQLQMMIGPSHPRARAKSTLRALEVLDEMDALSPEETRSLREGYLWLRVAEHRLQLWNEQAIRVLPTKNEDKAALARRLGCAWRGEAASRFLDEEHAHFAGAIRALCERLFWTFAHSEDDGVAEIESLLPEKTRDKTQIARLNRLAHGTSSRPLPSPLSRQIRAALPGAMRGLNRAANVEKALTNFENLCEASGNRLSLLRSLDASPRLCDALWTILGGAQTLAQTLIHAPQLLDLAANRTLLSRPKSPEEARADCRDYCLAFRDRKAALRRFRGRELLRIGLRDLVMDAPPHEITGEIALLAGACLDLACDEIRGVLRPDEHQIAFSVIGMGKFGGVEMHYGSDCDVVFAFSAPPNSPSATSVAARFAEQLIAFSGERTEDGAGFPLDARLRPYGSSGALASSLVAFEEYFENEKSGFAAWERQALTRARFAAGDGAVGARFMALARGAAFPAEWKAAWSEELKHVKSRVENERASKGATKNQVFDLKLGPGGLSDIEWSAQWLAMKHGAKFPNLQTPNTRRQLLAAREAGVLAPDEYQVLEDAYTWLRRAELRLQIAREGAASGVKRGSDDAALWARALFPGLKNGEATERFEGEWTAHTQRARQVFERVCDVI
ncbi:glutamate-ammonia-ligase adenylyltransferase [Abditibacterium utsteinense]|uniref:Glutamate-ammonia-ligase adenylyltransferase n=1 Tax=Abditibacterium utsteinense TaxID=1960156 RepID=A0A2S8SQX1_9BACT|nr:putative nucleotidyltransferase substrate binding domain-containing protein [Abditibacterium utsteinense]PQV63190.1 glutamate-ammonia-ligase adenylyltransferase [Abditibacterium utsteinense]